MTTSSRAGRSSRSAVPSGIFYYWKGDRPQDPNAPQLDGMGEILLEFADRAAGVLHDSCGRARERELADRRCSLARRSRGRGYPGRKRRRATCGVDRRAAEAMEVDRERLAVERPVAIGTQQCPLWVKSGSCSDDAIAPLSANSGRGQPTFPRWIGRHTYAADTLKPETRSARRNFVTGLPASSTALATSSGTA